MYNLKVLGAVGLRADDADGVDLGLLIAVSTWVFCLLSICLVQQIQIGAIMKINFFIDQLVSYKLIQLKSFTMSVTISGFFYVDFPASDKKSAALSDHAF